MTILLTTLLAQVSRETKSIVDQTRQRFNQAVRQALRAETRLQLSNLAVAHNSDEHETRTVRVLVTPGMPQELEPMCFDDTLWLAIELAPLVGVLESAQRTMKELHDPIMRLSGHESFQQRFSGAIETVSGMGDLAAALLDEAAKFDLLQRLFAINEDVLGLYSYHLPPRDPLFDEERQVNARADLYWCVIGLISKVLGVTVEALTVTVLAHELAHAYTHLGADADGKRWDAHAFAESERALKEGLAQYYTVRVLDRLKLQIPEARLAYDKLLPCQPPPYHTHLPWLEHFKPEEVRDAMVRTRRNGIGTVAAFSDGLDEARSRLRNN
jgi:hypothetical protein